MTDPLGSIRRIAMKLHAITSPLVFVLSATLALSAQETNPQTWTIDGNRVVAKFSAMVAGNLLFRDAGGKEIKTTMGALPFDQQRTVMKLASWGREWNDATFKHTTLAALFDVGPNSVVLEKPDGTKITVPLEKLSASDRNYVKKWVKPTVPIASLPSGQAIPDPPEINKSISVDPSIVEWQKATPDERLQICVGILESLKKRGLLNQSTPGREAMVREVDSLIDAKNHMTLTQVAEKWLKDRGHIALVPNAGKPYVAPAPKELDPNRVTKNNYLKLDVGMSRADVSILFAVEGQLWGERLVRDVHWSTYKWYVGNGDSVWVDFEDDKVVSKSYYIKR